MSTADVPPRSGHRAAGPRLLALIVSCSMFMAQLDSTIITTALPRMAESFHTAPVNLSICITVYLLVQAVFLPASGWVADRYGARHVFAAAMTGFTIASALCGLAGTLPELVAARVLQAVAAALMTPVGRVVLVRSVARHQIMAAMAISSTPMLLAPTIGPPLGGLIVTYFSWRWVFLLNLPIGVLGTVLALRFIPDAPESGRRPFDLRGFVLTGVALSLLLLGLDRIAGAGRDWPLPAAVLAGGVAFAVAAVRHGFRAAHPLVTLSPLLIPSFRQTSFGGGALARLPVRAAPFILPLMFQTGMSMTAFRSGLLLLGFSGGDLLLKTITTRTLRRFGFRSALMVSATLMSLTIAACAGFGRTTPLGVIFALVLACGMARSVLFSGMNALVYADVPQTDLGGATVLWNVTQQVSNALGISVSAIVLNFSAEVRGRAPGQLGLPDYRAALLVMAAFGLLSVLSFRRLPADAGAELSGYVRR